MEILVSLLEIAGVLLIVALNGFFVATEFAIVKVRSTQIEQLVQKGSKRAGIAYNVITHLDAYLSATQLGVTMTSLALGWVGEPYVADLLFPLFSLAGIFQPPVVYTISFAVAFSIITFVHIVLGELAPKWIAIQHPQRTALMFTPVLNLFFSVFRPFIWLLNRSANALLRMVGIQPARESEIAHSEDELRLLLGRGKTITSMVKSISLRAMDLRERTVREVMVPRTSITYLSIDNTIEENIAIALENQFTRYPLCDRSLDNILGMIHLKDLFKLKGAHGEGTKLLEIKREMLFVPETSPLEKVLNTFLNKRVLMAIAVDEYGGTAGLVTLENVLEELVGDIRDEFDVEPVMVQKVTDTEYVVDGAMPLHDFAKMFNMVPDSRGVVTVSGYAIQRLGGVPKEGAAVRMGDWNVTIEGTEARKVRKLRLRKVKE
jgi:CBS domain containing-hemolysin-like protein